MKWRQGGEERGALTMEKYSCGKTEEEKRNKE